MGQMEEVNGTFGVRHPPHSVGHFSLFLKVTAVSESVNYILQTYNKKLYSKMPIQIPQKERSGWGDFYGAFNDVSIHWREERTKEGKEGTASLSLFPAYNKLLRWLDI